MTRRKKIAIAVAVILLLALIALMIFLRRPAPAVEAPVPEPETESQPLPTSGAVGTPSSPQVAALNPAPVQEEEQAPPGYLQVAELFAERYGSYSNQEAYANLRDLLPIMSAAYRARSEAQIAAADGQPPAANYEGVTSAKLTAKEVAYDAAGTATVDVGLQQSKTIGTAPPEISYRTLRVMLVKTGDEWRVDSVAWRN